MTVRMKKTIIVTKNLKNIYTKLNLCDIMILIIIRLIVYVHVRGIK